MRILKERGKERKRREKMEINLTDREHILAFPLRQCSVHSV